MVLKRNKKTQQIFIELSIKYGAVSRFWNEIKAVQTVHCAGGPGKKERQIRQNSARTIKRKRKLGITNLKKKKTVPKPRYPKTPKPSQLEQQFMGFMQQQMSAFQTTLQKTIAQALTDVRPPPQRHDDKATRR